MENTIIYSPKHGCANCIDKRTPLKLFTATLLFALSTSIAFNTQAQAPDNRHIVVSAKGEVQAPADRVSVTILVESQKQESADAKHDVDYRVNRFLDGLNKFNISPEDLMASQLMIHPRYSYINNSQTLVGYNAKRSITVVLAKVEQLNALIDFALDVKLNQIQNIQLQTSQSQVAENEAMDAAVKNAKQKAKRIARSLGVEVGDVYSVTVNSNGQSGRFGQNASIENVEYSRLRAAPAQEPGQYLQKNIVFSAAVTVTFDLNLN